MSHDPIARVIFSNEQLTFCCDDLHRSLDRPVSRHARLEDRRSEQLAVQQVAKSHASLVLSALIPLHAFDALARSLEARIRSLAGAEDGSCKYLDRTLLLLVSVVVGAGVDYARAWRCSRTD